MAWCYNTSVVCVDSACADCIVICCTYNACITLWFSTKAVGITCGVVSAGTLNNKGCKDVGSVDDTQTMDSYTKS